MRSLTLALFILVLVAPANAPAAYQVISAQSVAAQNGYTFTWLGPENAVSLSRPGMVIVLRPGSVLYEVNARVEVADQAPLATSRGDVLISSALAWRLRALARQASDAAPSPEPPARGAATEVPRGSIVLQARQLDDAQSLAVAGQAPPNAPITITVLATLASEIPTVVLSRMELQSDVDGRFDAVVPVAADYIPGSLLTLVATSAAGVSPASTTVRLGTPNAGFSVPIERVPRRAS